MISNSEIDVMPWYFKEIAVYFDNLSGQGRGMLYEFSPADYTYNPNANQYLNSNTHSFIQAKCHS